MERQRRIYIGRVRGWKGGDLDGGEVAIVCPSNADIAVAGRCTASLPGKLCDLGLGAGRGVEAEDVDSAGVVDEVGLGTADEMAQLVVSGGS